MLAQWKSDGLITRKSLDRNEDMLKFKKDFTSLVKLSAPNSDRSRQRYLQGVFSKAGKTSMVFIIMLRLGLEKRESLM